MGRRRLIVTADDFGLAVPVNEAVEVAHRDGVLACTSLMVAAPAAADAVARARRLPDLRVGLHVALVDACPALAPDRIPDLVDTAGRFRAGMFRNGVRFFFLPRVRLQLAAEIRAQFEAFRATGLELDHVNAHKHMHLHPTVLGLILRIGREYGIPAVRLPYEPLHSARCIDPGRLASRVAWSLFLAPWTALMRRRLRRAGVKFNRFLFGLSTTGDMTEETVLRILDCLPEGVSEIYFHPATSQAPATPGHAPLPMPVARHEAEYRALVSPRVRAAIFHAEIDPVGFSELV